MVASRLGLSCKEGELLRFFVLSGRTLQRGVAILILSLSPGIPFAHHSIPVNYLTYQESPLVLSGTVMDVHVRNPHSTIVLEAVVQGETVTEWLIHWADGNTLRRRGATLDKIRVGEPLTVYARRHKRVPNVAYFRSALLPDGTLIPGCAGGVYRGNEYFATCDREEAHYGVFPTSAGHPRIAQDQR